MKTYGIAVNSLNTARHTGVERYLTELLREMMHVPLRPDERVLLYAASIPKGLGQLPKGWEWRVLPFGRGWTHVRLSWELWRNPPDVFFNPTHEVPRYVSGKTKVVSTVHDLAFKRFPGLYPQQLGRRQEWAIRRAIKKSARLVAISETTKHDLIELYNVANERIAVAPLAVRSGMFEGSVNGEILRRYRLAAKKYFLYVGRLEGKKNVATLVRGFGEFRRFVGEGHPVELVLVGSWGYGREKIEAAMRAVGDAVRVLGYVADDDLPHVYRGALALCFPSYYEGFGLPVLEAFAADAPVIASTAPALREVAGDAAMFAPPDDAHAWSEAMRNAAMGDVPLTTMVEKGREQLAKYSWQQTAQLTWDALRSV